MADDYSFMKSGFDNLETEDNTVENIASGGTLTKFVLRPQSSIIFIS